MARFLFGAGGPRRLALSWRKDDRLLFKHIGPLTLPNAGDIVHLFLSEIIKNKKNHSIEILWDRKRNTPILALHFGWIQSTCQPLYTDPVVELENYVFELVFDFDLPLWDVGALKLRSGFLCHCASPESKIAACRKCWLLIRLARCTLDYFFSESGWGPGLWTYSGGKGAHCYYGSQAARGTPLSERVAIAAIINTLRHADATISATLLDRLLAFWEGEGVDKLRILDSDAACMHLARGFLVEGSVSYSKFSRGIEMLPKQSSRRWLLFKAIAGPQVVSNAVREICLPAFDSGPLGSRNGQIKGPFSVHSSTRRIALPLNDEDFSSFDPQAAVAVESLYSTDPLIKGCIHFEKWLNVNEYA